ncbi:TraX family protein [Clostridium sp. CTA-5]
MKLFKEGFDGFTIKILALILMTFDHIAYFMPNTMNVPIWFHWIGRIVAPLFIFMVVEGFYHTRNRKKYIIRLYIWSIIMGLGNSLVQKIVPHPTGMPIINNMFATLFLTTLYLQGIEFIKRFKSEKTSKHIVLGLSLIIIPSLLGIIVLFTLFVLPPSIVQVVFLLIPTPFLVEGGIAWVALGVILYLCRDKKIALTIAYTLFTLFIYVANAHGDYSLSNSFLSNYQWIMIGALPFMLLYNNQKGRGMKYLFYLYYPLHVYILYILGILLVK